MDTMTLPALHGSASTLRPPTPHTHTLTQNLTASAFPDLDHMSYIHFLAAVTSVQAKAISKYLETWLYSIKSSY